MLLRVRTSLFCALIVAAALIAGCKSSTGPLPSGTLAVTRPGVGSTFIYHYQEFDTLGRAIAGQDAMDTTVVVASGISYQGKTNVVEFRNGSIGSSNDVSYVNYESNGDVSGWHDGGGEAGNRSGWETVPLATKGGTSFLVYDSTWLSGGNQIHEAQTDEYTYTGEQTVAEAGTSFDALVFKFQSVITGNNFNNYEDYTTTEYIAPSLGGPVKDETTFAEADSRGAIRATDDLVSYTLK